MLAIYKSDILLIILSIPFKELLLGNVSIVSMARAIRGGDDPSRSHDRT